LIDADFGIEAEAPPLTPGAILFALTKLGGKPGMAIALGSN
jgi:hypothetical protein